MVHAVSANYLRSEHMSPPAAGMALVLHVSVALALWWVSPLKFTDIDLQAPIEVTMEAPPKPIQPPAQPSAATPPPAQSAAPPASTPSPATPSARATPQVPLGVPPPSSGVVDKPQAEPPKTQEPQEALASPKIAPQPAPAPEPPPVDKVLPKVEPPPPPLTMQDFVKIAPPPQPRDVVKPLPQQVAPAPQQTLKPSPLSSTARQAPPETSNGGASAKFVNPANTYSRVRIEDRYIWEVIGPRILQYRYSAGEQTQHNPIVIRLAIMRDGRLTEASIDRSSGSVAVDKGLLEAARAASPYPPLPAEIDGSPHTFIVTFAPQYRR